MHAILPEREYVTFGSLLSQICLSSVCLSARNVRAPFSGVETFGNISSLFCTLAILSPPCKISRRSSQSCVGGVKRKSGSKIQRCHVRVSHLLVSILSTLVLKLLFSQSLLLSGHLSLTQTRLLKFNHLMFGTGLEVTKTKYRYGTFPFPLSSIPLPFPPCSYVPSHFLPIFRHSLCVIS